MATRVLVAILALGLTACDDAAVPPPSNNLNPSADGVDGTVQVDGNDGAEATDGSVLADGVDASDGAFDGAVGSDDAATDGSNDGGESTDGTIPQIDPYVCDFSQKPGTYFSEDDYSEQVDVTLKPTLNGCEITATFWWGPLVFTDFAFPIEEPAPPHGVQIMDCGSPNRDKFSIQVLVDNGDQLSNTSYRMPD